MNKIIVVLMMLALLMMISSCQNPIESQDGSITVSVSGLQSMTGFDADSDVTVEILTGSYALYGYYTVENVNADSFSGTLGNPAESFPAGTYLIDVLVDIDANGSYEDTGTDYWLTYYYQIEVDGDQSISFSFSDFEFVSDF